MKNFITVILLLISSIAFGQTGSQFIAKILNWNAYVHLPASYATSTSKYNTIIFFPGTGEAGTVVGNVIKHGPGAHIAQGWDGNATVNGVTTEFIVISLQPPTLYPVETLINDRIAEIKKLYRVDKIFLTGLSHGGWCAETFVTGDILGGPYTYASQIAGVATYVAQNPDDNKPFPGLFANFAKSGGKYFAVEQLYDGRYKKQNADVMNAAVPNSAFFLYSNFGNGGHNSYNYFFGGQGVQPSKFTIGGKSLNVYEWFASLSTSAPVIPVVPAPVISTPGSFILTVGDLFSYNVTATNSPTSFAGVTLPAGLSISATGQITGTPTTVSFINSTISAANAGGTGTAAFTFNIVARPKTIGYIITYQDLINPACSWKQINYTDGTQIKEKL